MRPMQQAEPYIVCDNLVKIYQTEDLEVVALQGLDLEIQRGEMMAIIGNSGSGKSTLLSVLGGLDRPSAGQCRIGDLDVLQASEADLVHYKRHGVGFVWQQSSRNLVPYLTAFENVQLPMLFGNLGKSKTAASPPSGASGRRGVWRNLCSASWTSHSSSLVSSPVRHPMLRC